MTRSYASLRKNLFPHISDIFNIFKEKTRDIPGRIAVILERIKDVEASVLRNTGLKLEGIRMLEIGTGQLPLRLRYFSEKNDVTGIDYDPVPEGFDIPAYGRLLFKGDPLRLVKTAGRKIVGVDRASFEELKRQAGLRLFRRMNILEADAEALPFADASFDFVYSFSVFEHLKDPAKALEEAARVLKPGGAFYIATHIYTSDNGCHDARVFSGRRDGIPLWAHLDPEHAHKVKPNAYLNKIRLGEWKEIFLNRCPGVQFEYKQYDREAMAERLGKIRAEGKLSDYSDEELLTVDLVAVWKKPR